MPMSRNIETYRDIQNVLDAALRKGKDIAIRPLSKTSRRTGPTIANHWVQRHNMFRSLWTQQGGDDRYATIAVQALNDQVNIFLNPTFVETFVDLETGEELDLNSTHDEREDIVSTSGQEEEISDMVARMRALERGKDQ